MIHQIKQDIMNLLSENPEYTKGDLIIHFNLPINDSQSDLSKSLSKTIWQFNHNNDRKGYYSMTPNYL